MATYRRIFACSLYREALVSAQFVEPREKLKKKKPLVLDNK